MKGGEDYNGDQESPGKKSEENHEKEITHSAMGYISIHSYESLPRRRSSWFCFSMHGRLKATHILMGNEFPGRRRAYHAQAELYEG
jgi:hypothetical protein